MIIKTKYKFGDSLYLKSDPEQTEFTLVGVLQRPGALLYELTFMGESFTVYDFEVADEKDVLKTLDASNKDNE